MAKTFRPTFLNEPKYLCTYTQAMFTYGISPKILSFYPNPIFLAGFGPRKHFLTPKGGTGELKMEQD